MPARLAAIWPHQGGRPYVAPAIARLMAHILGGSILVFMRCFEIIVKISIAPTFFATASATMSSSPPVKCGAMATELTNESIRD